MTKLVSYLQLGGIALIAGQLTYIIVNNQTNITNEGNIIEKASNLTDIKEILQDINENLSFVATTMGKRNQAEAEAIKQTKEFMSKDKKWNPFKSSN